MGGSLVKTEDLPLPSVDVCPMVGSPPELCGPNPKLEAVAVTQTTCTDSQE